MENQVTFPEFPGVNVRLTEVSDPTGIKLLVCLHLAMGVTSGGQWSWKTSCRQYNTFRTTYMNLLQNHFLPPTIISLSVLNRLNVDLNYLYILSKVTLWICPGILCQPSIFCGSLTFLLVLKRSRLYTEVWMLNLFVTLIQT